MVDVAAQAEELDEYLNVVVQAVKSACTAGVPRIKDDPAVVEKTLGDCEEILNTIMAGKVEEWIS